jgi:hypothetical protein
MVDTSIFCVIILFTGGYKEEKKERDGVMRSKNAGMLCSAELVKVKGETVKIQ